MVKKDKKTKCKCKTCGEKTTKIGHLCDPKIPTQEAKLYICQGCGLITTEEFLLCKPRRLRLK